MTRLNLSRRNCSYLQTILFWSLASFGFIAVIGNAPACANPYDKMTFAQVENRHHELVKEAEDILLSRGDWTNARKLLDEARNLSVTTVRGQFPYRSKEADFYWAWILCHTPADRDDGRKLLDKILQVDLWPADKLVKIKIEREQCGSGSSKSPPSVKQKVEDKFALAAIQKGGKWSQPVRLQQREVLPILPWEKRDIAKTAINKVFKSYSLVESQPFIVAGPFSEAYLTKLSNTVLVPYFKYLTQSLGVDYDSGIIYALVSQDHTQFATMTNSIYRVEPQDRIPIELSIAFSDFPNNTMMAICGKDASNCTSFAHELFHVLNSKAFADAPWWLDEGMAELFESGDLKEGVFHARPGWRKYKSEIDKLDTKSLVDLLSISKNDPTLYKPPGAEIAMSRVRFFCRYLHDQGSLLSVYDELRGRDWREIAADPAGVAVIEKILKKPIDAVNADFRRWFVQVVLPEPSTHGP